MSSATTTAWAVAVAVCALAPAARAEGPAAGAVTAETVKLPAGPGSVRGLADNASVSAFTGQVRYEVPIALPTAPGGITPSLSLGYDGGLGNGELGVGWSLAQPTIRRSLRLGIPSYDATDELELAGLTGGQLVAVPGGYRVEGRGNAITGSAVGGGFSLTDAEGTTYRFGTTPEARKASALGVAVWHLEQVRDVSGDTIDYRYHQDQGDVYLDAIEWGPSPGGVRAYRAELIYQARPDAVVSYRTGGRVATAQRLARINVWVSGGVQRTVELTYDETFALTRLARVVVTGVGGVDALPALTFAYAAAAPGTPAAVTGVDGWAIDHQGTSLFDVDQDGAMDLLRLTTTGHSWRRNLGGAFGPAQTVPGAASASLDKVRLLDLTGDSIGELVWQQGSQWFVYALQGGAWVATGSLAGAANVPLATVGIADLDGDYRMDVLQVAGSMIRVRMGGPSGLAAPVTRPAIDAARPFIQPGNAETRLHDINGDGLVDVVYLASSQMYLYLGRGDGTFEPLADVPYPWTGTVASSQIHLADLDRDGLLDVAAVRAGDVTWHRGRVGGAFDPAGASVPRPPGTDGTVVVTAADANGNGSEDLVWSSDAGMWILDLAGPTTAGMLIAIDNGLGQIQRFVYAASTQLAQLAATAGAPWTSTAPLAMPVATRNRLELASGEPPRSNRLDVRDIIYDRSERRFVGFLEAVTTRPDPADGAPPAQLVRRTQRFAAGLGIDRAIRGQIVLERIESGTGAILRETISDHAAVAVAGLPDEARLRVAITRSVEVRHFEGQPAPLVTRTEVEYDAEARAIAERSLGRLDLTGDESITRRRYTDGTSALGVRDQLCEERLLAPDPSAPGGERLVSHAQTLYGDGTAIAPLCDASTGWVRSKRSWLASEGRWIEVEAARPNATGDPISKVRDGVTRDLEYDPVGHPIAELVHPSTTSTLRWEMTWDLVLERPLTVRDAAGAVATLGHDGLGRLRTVAHAGALPHVHYRYHHTAPRPYTETFTYDGPETTVPALPASWTAASKWRHVVDVFTSTGEPLFDAVRLGGSKWLVTDRRVRDALGRTTAVAEPYVFTGSLAELVASALPAAAPVRTATYDALDRVIAQGLPTGEQTTHSYRAFELTDSATGLAPVITTYDGAGRILRTQRTVGGVVEAAEASYDTAGAITAMRILGGAAPPVEHRYEYDSLGRLTLATDPDLGTRGFSYDDGGHLVKRSNGAGQTIVYAYDGAGRVVSTTTDADTPETVTFHYDDALDPAAFGYTASRLAWVEEPTGRVELGYSRDGHEVHRRRTVGGRTADQLTALTASGMVRQLDHDGLVLGFTYDPAGRLTAIGDLWQVETLDAAGRVMREHFANGVVQTWTRDALGRALRSRVLAPSGTAYHDVRATYGASGAVTAMTDLDGTGLDHSAAYTYDAGGRLATARIGSGAAAYQFAYQYDGLQNMVRRTATGPTQLGMLTGTYHHGEPDMSGAPRGPRQLTSVVPDAGAPTTLDYDGAGRMTRTGSTKLAYDAWDRLVGVTGLATGSGALAHSYGHDGQRVRTLAPDGTATIWFSRDVSETADGVRQIDVRDGDRLLARVTRTPAPPLAAAAPIGRTAAALGVLAACVLALASLMVRRLRRARPVLALVAIQLSCGAPITAAAEQAAFTTTDTVYYHVATGAGPALVTRADGTILDERRYEPFGAAIDSYRMLPGGGTEVGPVDLRRDPHDGLNQEREPVTGWSYQGARWLAPELAVWSAPDPPLRAPDATYLAAPWAAHPYQYVQQNPIAFWDPDGQQPSGRGDGGSFVPPEVRAMKKDLERYEPLVQSVTAVKEAGAELGTEVLECMPFVGTYMLARRGEIGWAVVSGFADLFTFGAGSAARGAVTAGRTAKAVKTAKKVATVAKVEKTVKTVATTATKVDTATFAFVAHVEGSPIARAGARGFGVLMPRAMPTEGIYKFMGRFARYGGQSGQLMKRLLTHSRKGKLPWGRFVSVREILGGKTAREIEEHLMLKEMAGPGGLSVLENKVWPIGKAREHLLPKP